MGAEHEAGRWQIARRALLEGVAFLDGEGRVSDCDLRFAELLDRLLRGGVLSSTVGPRPPPPRPPTPEALVGEALQASFEGAEFEAVRELLSALPPAGQLQRLLLPGRGFALRLLALEPPGAGSVVILHELQTAAVDDDVGLLREQISVRDELIATQRRVIDELTAPIIPVSAGLCVVPLIGSFDRFRLEDAIERMLHVVSSSRARVMAVDLTGVSRFEGGMAEGLSRLRTTLAMLGARAVFTGIGPELAQELARQELPPFEVYGSLQEAVELLS